MIGAYLFFLIGAEWAFDGYCRDSFTSNVRLLRKKVKNRSIVLQVMVLVKFRRPRGYRGHHLPCPRVIKEVITNMENQVLIEKAEAWQFELATFISSQENKSFRFYSRILDDLHWS